MSTIPEFPLEKLSKAELLKLIEKMRQDRLFLREKTVREFAFTVREETLFQEYRASAAACSAASARVQAVPDKQVSRFYEALAESARLVERSERAYRKYRAFSDQREDVSCAP